MTISQPLIVLDQNPLGGKVYLGQGSKPCPNCMDTSQLKFLHLATSEKNGHLMISTQQSSIFQSNDKKWEIPRSQVRAFSILGEGCFGQVFKGEVENIPGNDEGPTVVAIKTLKNNATDKDKRDLLNELSVMKMMETHPNVVRLLGKEQIQMFTIS